MSRRSLYAIIVGCIIALVIMAVYLGTHLRKNTVDNDYKEFLEGAENTATEDFLEGTEDTATEDLTESHEIISTEFEEVVSEDTTVAETVPEEVIEEKKSITYEELFKDYDIAAEQTNIWLEKADISSLKETKETLDYSGVDFSVLRSDAAVNVAKQLCEEQGSTDFEIFAVFYDEYDVGRLTNTYYLTFDKEVVYYIYEQIEDGTAYSLEDDKYSYNDVLQMIE